jgi:hypothetical protein
LRNGAQASENARENAELRSFAAKNCRAVENDRERDSACKVPRARWERVGVAKVQPRARVEGVGFGVP